MTIVKPINILNLSLIVKDARSSVSQLYSLWMENTKLGDEGDNFEQFVVDAIIECAPAVVSLIKHTSDMSEDEVNGMTLTDQIAHVVAVVDATFVDAESVGKLTPMFLRMVQKLAPN